MGRTTLDGWIDRSPLRRVLRRHRAQDTDAASPSSSFSSAAAAAPGVLSLEVSRVFFRLAHLWNALTDDQISRLRDHVFRLAGVRKLVGEDSGFLFALALAETLEALGAASRAAALLCRRCSADALRKLERAIPVAVAAAVAVGGDLAPPPECDAEVLRGWAMAEKKMEKKAREMERQAAATVQLFQEMEILAEMEGNLRRAQSNAASSSATGLTDLAHKVEWQQREVRALREQSLWDITYDDIVRLLARTLLTVALRVHAVFGGLDPEWPQPNGLLRSHSESARRAFSSPLLRDCRTAAAAAAAAITAEERHHHSGPLLAFWRKPSSAADDGIRKGEHPSSRHRDKPMWATRAISRGSLWGCIHREEAPGKPSEPSATSAEDPPPEIAAVAVAKELLRGGDLLSGGGGGTLARLAVALGGNADGTGGNTLGASAMALRFANIIVAVDKLAECPRLIGRRERDELYGMLPRSVRAALRAKLKPCAGDLARRGNDPALAAEWRGAVARILEWLSPLAHNTVRWQSERRFEQQQWPSRPSVLLLQTLQFADHAKTEAAVVELLVGLNYLWRSARAASAGPSSQS